jgi:hypothetical protein
MEFWDNVFYGNTFKHYIFIDTIELLPSGVTDFKILHLCQY